MLAIPQVHRLFVLSLLIVLHNATGHPVLVNEDLITIMRGPEPESDPLFVEGVRCMVNTSDGKFIAVVETCNQVRKLINDANQK